MVTFVKDFENVILSDYSEEAMNSFIQGSESHLYVSICKQIKTMAEYGKVPDNVTNYYNNFSYFKI